jgi:hypothetical protein
VREYREVLRRSLQEFLNRHLADLNFMFRTGAFVVGVVRAKVVELRPVPKYAMRQFGRAFKKPGRWKTLRKPTRMKNGT